MAAKRYSVIEAIEHQAAGCERAGSPLYGALLRGLALDHRAGGVTAELLDGVSERPLHDAIPLRLLATGHRLALEGSASELAGIYPSCGGVWDGDDPTPAFLRTVEGHRDEFVDGLGRTVQTNEVGRAAVLTAGFCAIAGRHGTRVRAFEIGASAGLLSRWPSFGYDTGETRAGDPGSAVQFGASWFRGPTLPRLRTDIEVVERAACDIAPVDAATSTGRLRMLSFLWPDQLDRFDRLRMALDVAADDPVTVDRADAGDWLAARLGADRPSRPVVTVVFHSIVWQYLSPSTRDGVRSALRDTGSRPTGSQPVCWLRMEPATPDHADLRLTTWDGSRTGDAGDPPDEVLAHVGYHGSDIRWLS
ncbi:MAG: DUF2332 domain-containing protein [Ilumatobacteraceae bacterium]